MGEYDLVIMVSIIFALSFFSIFMYYYLQDPVIELDNNIDYSHNWSEPQPADKIGDIFDNLSVLDDIGLWIISVFVSALTCIGGIIVLRFLRGQ